MGALDSIRMGQRCRDWVCNAGPPPDHRHVRSAGISSVSGQKWIVNAARRRRLDEVKELSQGVLDGGPRWVLSTALGFVTGGLWWTVVIAAVLVLANYAMYSNTENSSWTSGAELVGVVGYTILAVAISVSSVSDFWRASKCKGLAPGLFVEVVLCVSVIVSSAIIHDLFSSALEESSGLSMFVEVGRWSTPAALWTAASHCRAKAMKAVQTRLSGFWGHHPIVESDENLDEGEINARWNTWAQATAQCASRIGGYSMLGFSAEDLVKLSASSPTPAARREIQLLRSGLREGGSTNEEWVEQSLAFLEGYGTRLAVTMPERSCEAMHFKDVQALVRSLALGGCEHGAIQAYQDEIESSHQRDSYTVRTRGDNDQRQWFLAGALIADSDSRVHASRLPEGSYGPRFAIAVSVIARGTDPSARLTCYQDTPAADMLKKAIRASVKSLVSALADRAGVTNVDAVGERGLACVGEDNILSYSPDEMVAASHTEEVFVITDKTFSSSSDVNFETFWQGAANVKRRVDISDMVPSDSDANPRNGWICHFGFTLAMVMLHLCDGSVKAIVLLGLVIIPARDEIISDHVDAYFFMIYINYVLNYTRLISRWASLVRRGQATKAKSNNPRAIVFLFANILPVAACYVLSGGEMEGTTEGGEVKVTAEEGDEWAWWLAFIPCMLANLPGLYRTFTCSWASAFQYVWWSWHMTNRYFSGRGYLGVVELRNRVGRNVLSVVNASNVKAVERVAPKRGKVKSTNRFVVVGGGFLPQM